MKLKTKDMVVAAFFTALVLMMTFVPNIGYIPTPWLKITMVHVPVVIVGIVYGPRFGGFLGFVFGLSSLISNTMNPSILSFVFTPFYMVGDFGGKWYSLVICFVPRILSGVVPAWVAASLKKRPRIATVTGAVAGSLTNTILVLGMIFLFYKDAFAAAKGLSGTAVLSALGTVVLINGIPEAVVAGLLALGIVPVLRMMKSR
ncbi:MAG: ECF transporter S component [Eubacteriales bacterium]|nr:ECF transporter S component [Eubacteriales bacterium]